MIIHKSSAHHLNTTEYSNNKITSVLLDIPYYDLLTWLQDTNGVWDVYPKTYQKDFDDVNVNPWQPENWTTNQTVNALPYQVNASCSMVWEQLAKAIAIGASGLVNANVHEDLVRKLFLPFIGRQVLVTFTQSKKLLNKLVISEPENYEWHLPFITKEERDMNTNHENICISVYRCAHAGKTGHPNTQDQIKEGNMFIDQQSPFMKHILRSYSGSAFRSNFSGWVGLDELIRNQVPW